MRDDGTLWDNKLNSRKKGILTYSHVRPSLITIYTVIRIAILNNSPALKQLSVYTMLLLNITFKLSKCVK